jgi:antitoxin (DNA-binding transcriptional repressor) of toxin-antitoxin stability system
MRVMSIREFNRNISAAFARVEAGETLDITRNGRVIAEVRPKPKSRMDEPEFRAARERMLARLECGIPGLSGPATYHECAGR